MAPVSATGTGVPRQRIDDPELRSLLARLARFDPRKDEGECGGSSAGNGRQQQKTPPVDVDGLVSELGAVGKWRFQEQADLYEWTGTLDAIDATLRHYLDAHPQLLLLPPSADARSRAGSGKKRRDGEPAEGEAEGDAAMEAGKEDPKGGGDVEEEAFWSHRPDAVDVHASSPVPPSVESNVATLLSFLSTLLRQATNKSVFNSLVPLTDLLASSSDRIAAGAVEALACLAVPSAMVRQLGPEVPCHAPTPLHSEGGGGVLMGRLMACAKGYGTRGCGLGLLDVVGMDDAVPGGDPYGLLGGTRSEDDGADAAAADTSADMTEDDGGQRQSPKRPPVDRRASPAGRVDFACHGRPDDGLGGAVNADQSDGVPVRLSISYEDMLLDGPGGDGERPAKCRRTDPPSTTTPPLKSSATLYLEALSRIRSSHPAVSLTDPQRFGLLSSVRLARSFHRRSTRLSAVERRLGALSAVVWAHPTQEMVSGYFAAQPELCGELVDLLRETVSAGNIGSGAANDDSADQAPTSLAALAASPVVPYSVRSLSLDVLTALVARRDPSGTLSLLARQNNVLAELGVGKGQYLGLLPALIRYSLASLNSFLVSGGLEGNDDNREEADSGRLKSEEGTDGNDDGGLALKSGEEEKKEETKRDVGLELGLAFLRATRPRSPPRGEAEELALEFVDSILTLTSAVISVPTGTASLTDCGLIPALVSTVALSGRPDPFGGAGSSYVEGLLRYLAAQAVTILEGAMVTHGNALSAFHELSGVDVLVKRIDVEMKRMRPSPPTGGETDAGAAGESEPRPPLTTDASSRILLFSAANCLTVAYHHSETPSAASAAPSAGELIRRPEMAGLLREVFGNMSEYGGALGSLLCTFVSHLMNQDPQIVHWAHRSGLASCFLGMFGARGAFGDDIASWDEPRLGPNTDLITSVPNVVAALSLTESGARSVREADPFGPLLAVFASRKYAMPNSRCLLSEMAAIVGTGLDEIMRHTPSLSETVMKAVVRVIRRVVYLGKKLAAKETEEDSPGGECERERTYIMQYAYNMAQLLEQILHNQEHSSLFLTHGGLDALLELVLHCVYPGGMSLLHHLSCVSASAAMLHSTTANMVANHVRGLAANADGARCIKALVRHLDGELDDLAGIASSMQPMDDDGSDCEEDEDEEDNPFRRILSSVPAVPIYELKTNPENATMTSGLASLYQSVLRVDWLSQNLGFAIKSCQQRSGNEFSLLSSERNAAWRSELEGTEFRGVVDAMSRLHRSALREVCRVRTEVSFDERDMRLRRSRPPEGIVYRFRIVCQEGAIVRDGIDIDRCENVGGLEMGEVVSAADRCVNASGILRYRTDRGWVSEYTRGHGRENIAEVISVSLSDGDSSQDASPYAWRQDRDGGMGRVECGIPDLRSASASLLSRLHAGQAALFGSIRRAITGGVRPPLRRSGGSTTIRPNVFASSELLATNLRANFSPVDGDGGIGADGCMYLGNQLALLLVALGEERDGLSRTQRQAGSLNMPLLINLLASSPGGWTEGIVVDVTNDDGSLEEDVKPAAEREVPAFLQAVRAVLSFGLADAARLAAEENAGTAAMDTDEKKDDQAEIDAGPQRLSRAVASSLPSALALLRRLAASPLVDTSSVSWLSQTKDKDAVRLLGLPELAKGKTVEFDASRFTRAVQMEVGKVALDVVGDDKLAKGAPSNILHPLLCALGDVLRSLEEAAKVTEPPPSAPDVGNSISLPVGASIRDILPDSRGGRMLRAMGLLPGGPDDEGGEDVEEEEPPFEPSEEAITQLAEMGFGRDHAEEALDAVGTNRVEVAMEYMLSHPPSDADALERMRAARTQRREEYEARQAARDQDAEENPAAETNGDINDGAGEEGAAADDAAEPSTGDDDPANDAGEGKEAAGVDKDDSEESKPRALTAEERRAKRRKEAEEKGAAEVQKYLETVKERLPSICLDIIEGSTSALDTAGAKLDDPEICLGESESRVLVTCNFMLDQCSQQTTPDLENRFGSELLARSKSCLEIKSGNHCCVKPGREAEFAALSHASAVFFRAVPRCRLLVLKNGLVGMISHCIRNITLTSALRSKTQEAVVWPRWLSPAMLLLDVMAQPTSVEMKDEADEGGQATAANRPSKKTEYGRTMAEHEKAKQRTAKYTRAVFQAIVKDPVKATPKKKSPMQKENDSEKKPADPASSQPTSEQEKTSSEQDATPGKDKQSGDPPLAIPTLLPLMHSETAEGLLKLCLQLLGLKSKKPGDKKHLEKVSPTPQVVNAALVLTLTLVRSRTLAAKCLQMGGADLVLALPDRCHFEGSRDLVTLLLRRMLEQEESTLNTMMETEIQIIVKRIFRKQHPSASAADRPRVNLKNFLQQAAPLITRDPNVFLKVFATSVKIDSHGHARSSLSSSRGAQVTLLSNEERSKNMKLLSGIGSSKAQGSVPIPPTSEKLSQESDKPKGRGRSKSPRRASKSAAAAIKQPDAGKPAGGKNQFHINGTPTNHVTSIILDRIVSKSQRCRKEADTSSTQPFLSTCDLLDTLSDLVLAIPSCSAVVHKYAVKSPVTNILSGCPEPPQTFVGCLLHDFLPLPRSTPKGEKAGTNSDPYKDSKILSFQQTRECQAASRLIVCLVARSGEGRRRVISDLIFALSGGKLLPVAETGKKSQVGSATRDAALTSEMWALQTWSELLLALQAPRSRNASSHQDFNSNSVLSFEVILMMLDHGAAHALMFALDRVNLEHPMAPSVSSAILRPLEIFTRASVSVKVDDLIAKRSKNETKDSRRVTFGPSQRSESSFVDNNMIDNVFEQQAETESDEEMDMEDEIMDDMDEGDDDEDSEDDGTDDDTDEDGDSEEEEMEIRLGHLDDFDSIEDDDDEDISSDSEEESDSEDESQEGMEEGEGVDHNEEDFFDQVEADIQEDPDAFGVDDDMFFQEDQADEPEAAARPPPAERILEILNNASAQQPEGADEDWTQVENARQGLGNLLLGELGLGELAGGPPMGGGGNRAGGLFGALGGGGPSVGLLENLSTLLSGGGPSGRGLGAALAEEMGIRTDDSGSGRGANITDAARSGRSNAGAPSISQIQASHGTSASMSGLGSTNSMELVYQGSNTAPNLPSRSRQPQISLRNPPSQYDTQLFGGQAVSSLTASTVNPTRHPLLRDVELAPVTSLQSDSSQRSNSGAPTSISTSFIAGPGGQMMRVSDRDDVGGMRRPVPLLAGWMDGGVSSGLNEEDFSISFGSALDLFLQAASRAQATTTSNTDSAVAPDNDQENEEAEEAMDAMDDGSADADNQAAEAPDAVANDDDDDDAAAADDDDDGPSENNPAEESIEDRSAPAAEGAETGNNSSEELPEGEGDAAMEDSNSRSTSMEAGEESVPDQDENMADHNEEESGQGSIENQNEEIAREETMETSGGGDQADGDAPHVNENNEDSGAAAEGEASGELTCPPDIDPEVFASLPPEMQQEIVSSHQETHSSEITDLGLDPDALAALPEDMRREAIAEARQDQQRAAEREQQAAAEPPADPSNAEEMDQASFLATLNPELRNEILLTADESFLQSLPPQIVAEANALRERAAREHNQRSQERAAAAAAQAAAGGGGGGNAGGGGAPSRQDGPASNAEGAGLSRRRVRIGKMRVEANRENLVCGPENNGFGPFMTKTSATALLHMFYMLSPVQPTRLVHKLLLNLCMEARSRDLILNSLVDLLNGNSKDKVMRLLAGMDEANDRSKEEPQKPIRAGEFPPQALIGTVSVLSDDSVQRRGIMPYSRRRPGGSGITANSIPSGAMGSNDGGCIPIVSRRIISALSALTKSSYRVSYTLISSNGPETKDCEEATCTRLLDLLGMPHYITSSSNLEQLLSLLEIVLSPLSQLPNKDVEVDLTNDRASPGREWVKIPRIAISPTRLHLLVGTLSRESCKDTSFVKIGTLLRRLSRVEANREVASSLGAEAIFDLKMVGVRLRSAQKVRSSTEKNTSISSSSVGVSLSTSYAELKLLRVLQMLRDLCLIEEQTEDSSSQDHLPDSTFVALMQSDGLGLESLWEQLEVCLKTVSVLEGISDDVQLDDAEEEADDENAAAAAASNGGTLKNSVAGLITRFLPMIEAFFMIQGNVKADSRDSENADLSSRVVQFAARNKVLLNALIRSNPSLLEKSLSAMVNNPKCRAFLAFDVKRAWFKTQVRRLRQQANRRYGSFRLTLRRKFVFEDTFHAFVHKNADELRGRLHITFVGEEGVDAGGLSREFFAILAKEMFNPNYALFMSTEDGCTFQPNPNSSINPDDKRYLRFVGRIVGKAVVDGYLLDAHFTRSLYKHMLGVKPTYSDMQAIDPGYYKNLQMILEHKLEDIGLDLTFSTESHSFGRATTVDLIPNGRNIAVTEDTKEKYVDLVCQHRMTTAIESQIKAFLQGFHELVDPEHINIFTAKELELLISGMPDIDIHDLKKNTDYNGYRPADKEIGWFWSIMFSLSRSEKAEFLQFVTGSSKVPLAGFSELQGMRGVQKFSITKVINQESSLPSAHTCFNALDLPVYSSEEDMKSKLLMAISEGAGGFGFA